MTTYTTRTDAITAVIAAIEATGEATAAEYDIDAIADEVIGSHAAGYAITDDEHAFWAAVANHARPPRMDGGELQTVREYLGLTIDNLAGILAVNPRTVRAWESGRDLIPERIREEVEDIEAATGVAVQELVAALNAAADPAVLVYRSDVDMHAARPDCGHLPARWWRMVVARAVQEVPGVVITTGP